jgi:predicted TIM-barrel enzyme
MVFDCFGNKKKVVIAMAHIGALPGSPLYDATGGLKKLIEGVLADTEALQAASMPSCSVTRTIGPMSSRRRRRASLR